MATDAAVIDSSPSELQGSSCLNLHVQMCVKSSRDPLDDPEEDLENVRWSDEIKIELLGINRIF